MKTDTVSPEITNYAGRNPTPLKADLEMLTSGLTSVFHGSFQIMVALDDQFAQKILDNLIWTRTELKEAPTVQTTPEKNNVGIKDGTVEKVHKSVAIKNPEPVGQTATSITKDDLTKIIVHKIKQNRSNNEKIRQILKTYSAAKVSELSTEQYEAFMTDLSAI